MKARNTFNFTISTRRFLLILCIHASLLSEAQIGSIRFNEITSRDGLAHEFVYTIVRDQEGYMWFGTRGGLNRYDGFDMKVYQHDAFDSTSICNNNVQCSFCTANGQLWFGTDNGLSRYNPRSGKFNSYFPQGSDGQSVDVLCMEEDRNHVLWIGTTDGLLVKRDNDVSFHPVSALHPSLAQLDSTAISDFYFRENTMYITTNGAGLWQVNVTKFSTEVWTTQEQGWKKLHSNRVRNVTIDKHGNMWLAYYDCVVERRNLETQELFVTDELSRYTRGDMKNQMADLVADKEGNIWVSTSLLSISVFDVHTNSFQHLKEKPFITAFDNTRSARSIYVDIEGTLWMAMHTSGVLYFNLSRQPFVVYERIDGLSENETDSHLLSNWVRAFAEDPRDRLWVGTTDGISILDRETQTFTSLRNKNEADQNIANNSIRSLLNVNDHYMLIGTAGGLTRYDFDTGKSRNYLANGDTIHSLHGNFVLDIVQSDNNRIYVTTSRGFSRYDEDSDSFYNWSEYPQLYKALRANTRCATVDDNGIIWISKSNGNLLEFHPDRLTVAEHQAPSIVTHSGNNNVLDMLDNGAILWMGTSAGLMKFDKSKKQFERITFPENNVPLMVGNLRMEDNEVLWFTGSTGLVKFNMVSHTTEVFKVHHGLPTNSFHFQRSFVTHDSTYCMASMHGVVMFKPENLKQLTYHPAVYITELRVLNEVVDRGVLTGNELSLDHDQNFFTVTLNAFDYLNKDIVQYAYMLEGLHEEWIYNGRNRQLSFLNVPGGNYVLKFKASTTDGIWPDSFQSMRIHIDTVFYKQWWFSVLLMALVAAIVFFIMKYRQQQRNKVESLRQKIASDLHDDIGATLSSIRMYSEVALSRNNNNEQLLERISDNARDMVDSMSDIVWAIKPGNDRMGDLQKRMENFALEMCGPSNIELTVQFDSTLTELKPDMELRRDIYLVFKEAVNNAVKYSACKRLFVSIGKQSGHLAIMIVDDGKGFDPATINKGNGLDNMRRRVTERKGSFHIESSKEKGTKITCNIPFTHFG